MIWLYCIAIYFFCTGFTAYMGEWAGWNDGSIVWGCILAPIGFWAALGAWMGRMASDAAGVHRNRLGRLERLEQAKFEVEIAKFEIEISELENQKKNMKELR